MGVRRPLRPDDRDVLAPLVDELLKLAARPIEAEKKKLWADHQAMRGTAKIPVCVYYEGIPAAQWKFMLGDKYLKCESTLGQAIETDLRKRIWMANNVNDDHIVWPWGDRGRRCVPKRATGASSSNWSAPAMKPPKPPLKDDAWSPRFPTASM